MDRRTSPLERSVRPLSHCTSRRCTRKKRASENAQEGEVTKRTAMRMSEHGGTYSVLLEARHGTAHDHPGSLSLNLSLAIYYSTTRWYSHTHDMPGTYCDWPSRGRIRDVIALGARSMVIPSLRLLIAPWSDAFDELDLLNLASQSKFASHNGRGCGSGVSDSLRPCHRGLRYLEACRGHA